MLAGQLARFRYHLDQPLTWWRWEIEFSMGKRAMARAAAVTVLTLAERHRVLR